MAAFHIVLRRKAVIGHSFLIECIYRIGLLQECIPDVFFIDEDLPDITFMPLSVPRTVQDAIRLQPPLIWRKLAPSMYSA